MGEPLGGVHGGGFDCTDKGDQITHLRSSRIVLVSDRASKRLSIAEDEQTLVRPDRWMVTNVSKDTPEIATLTLPGATE